MRRAGLRAQSNGMACRLSRACYTLRRWCTDPGSDASTRTSVGQPQADPLQASHVWRLAVRRHTAAALEPRRPVPQRNEACGQAETVKHSCRLSECVPCCGHMHVPQTLGPLCARSPKPYLAPLQNGGLQLCTCAAPASVQLHERWTAGAGAELLPRPDRHPVRCCCCCLTSMPSGICRQLGYCHVGRGVPAGPLAPACARAYVLAHKQTFPR